MRFPLVAAATVALSLIACNGPAEPISEIGPEVTRAETPGVSEPAPSSTPLTRQSGKNTLIETPEYTGVIISEQGASEFGYVLGTVVDGEKRIWCNFFFSEDSYPDWERVPVFVLDGGKDYWDIEYDVIEDECINFTIHGEA